MYSFSEEKEVQNGLFYHFIYKILVVNWSNMLNTESINIGSVSRKTGDVFSDSEKIFWKDGKQAMKVLSLET